MKRLFATIFAALFLLPACGDEGGNLPPGEGQPGSGEQAAADLPEGYGQIAIAIEGENLPEAPVVATVVVYKIQADGTDGDVEEEVTVPIHGTRAVTTVAVPAGKYNVELTLTRAEQDEAYMAGRRTGVDVLAGVSTQVSIKLSPTSGEVQVVAEITRRGHSFSCVEDSGTFNNELMSAQRLVEVCTGTTNPACTYKMQYHLWDVDSTELRMNTSADPTAWDPQTWKKADPGEGGGMHGGGMAAVGDGFLHAESKFDFIKLRRSDDGLKWLDAGQVKLEKSFPPTSVPGSLDQVEGLGDCRLLADSRLHAYCALYDPYLVNGKGRYMWGVAATSSNEGDFWSSIPKSAMPPEENPKGEQADVAFTVDSVGLSYPLGPIAGGISVMAVENHNSVHRLWYAENAGTKKLGSPPWPYRLWRFWLVESLDGENWTSPVRVPMTGCADETHTSSGTLNLVTGTGNYGPEIATYFPPDLNKPMVAYVKAIEVSTGFKVTLRLTSTD